MRRTRKRAIILGSAAAFAGSLLPSFSRAQIQTFTWDAGAGAATTNWSSSNNWLASGSFNNTVPVSGANILFSTAGSSAVLDSARTVGSIQFNRAGGFSLGGTSTLTLNTGIGVTSADGYSISDPI